MMNMGQHTFTNYWFEWNHLLVQFWMIHQVFEVKAEWLIFWLTGMQVLKNASPVLNNTKKENKTKSLYFYVGWFYLRKSLLKKEPVLKMSRVESCLLSYLVLYYPQNRLTYLYLLKFLPAKYKSNLIFRRKSLPSYFCPPSLEYRHPRGTHRTTTVEENVDFHSMAFVIQQPSCHCSIKHNVPGTGSLRNVNQDTLR